MKQSEFILVVQMPNQPQTMLGYETEAAALGAARYGMEHGSISNQAEVGHILVHTCPGTVYIILSKQAFERQAMQQQLAIQRQGRG